MSDTKSGALSAPGPSPAAVDIVHSGAVPYSAMSANTRSTTAKTGRIQPSGLATALARPRLNPRFRNTMPTSTPATMPRMPQIAVRSPPPRRSQARTVQPRKISAPHMKMKPSTNRTSGWLPPRARNSRVKSAAPIAPRMMPMISGRMYATAPCPVTSPTKKPVMSRRKHAMHRPMFPGLPWLTSQAATAPMNRPAPPRSHAVGPITRRSAIRFPFPRRDIIRVNDWH